MAVRYKKQYTNQSEYIYDLAKSTGKFDESTYNALLASNKAEDYASAVANTAYMTSDTFHQGKYDLLQGEDKYSYLINEYYVDKNSEDYEKNKAYLEQQVTRAIDAKTFDSLNGLEKVINTIGGAIGNALNETFLGTIEGLVDVLGTAVGGVGSIFNKDFGNDVKSLVAGDATGVQAIRSDLQQYARAYTYLDKNSFAKGFNDVVTGISKMAPLLIPGAGTAIYFSGMAGNTAEEAIQQKSDIDYMSLILYTGAVTATELATEKLSSVLFGGSAIDSLIFKTSGSKAGSWLGRIGLDFLSEGMEESIAEIADSILYTVLIDNNAPLASLGDVLYAGLIGGLIGGIGAAGRIATTSRIYVTKDGQIIDTSKYTKKELKTLDGKLLGKAQSLTLKERLANAVNVLDKNAITDLQAKYSNLTLDEIKTQHSDEYQKALDKNVKIQKELTQSILGLSKILEIAGEQQFKKAVDLANYSFEKQQELLNNYVNKTSAANSKNRIIEKFFSLANPGYSISINDNLTTTQRRLKDGLKRLYGKDVYFGKLGADYKQITKRHGLTINENTIVLDESVSNMSLDELINTVVKEELTHTLQYNKEILDVNTINDLHEQYIGKDGVVTDVKAKSEYKGKNLLTQMSENQANFLAQSLLFDDLTISRIFITNNSTFNKVYKWLNARKDAIEQKKNRKTNKDKVEYKVLLQSMEKYRKAVAKTIGNSEDAATAASEMNLTDEQLQKLIDTYLPDYGSEHYTLLGKNYTIHTEKRMEAEKFLSESRNVINRFLPLSYKSIFNPDYYKDDFVAMIMSRNPNEDFRYNLQEYMITTYNFTINDVDGCLMEIVDYNKVTTKDFNNDLSDLIANPDALNKYTTADQIFRPTFKNKFDGRLKDVDIKFVKITTDQNTQANYVRRNPETGRATITIYLKENTTFTPGQIDALKHKLFHEMTHALGDIQGLQNGTSTNYVKSTLLEIQDNKIIDKLSRLLLTTEYRNANKENKTAIIDALAYGIYRITDGEYAAESYPSSPTREGELKVALKAGATMNRSGFRTDGRVLYGYGRFSGIVLEAKTITQTKLEYDVKGLIAAKDVVSYSLENTLLKSLEEQGITDFEEAGFSDEFMYDVLENPEADIDDVWDKINKNSVGTPEATNKIINWLAPNNKNIKTIDDVTKVTQGNGLAYGFIVRRNTLKNNPEYDANKKHTFKELENKTTALMLKSDKNTETIMKTIEAVANKLNKPVNDTVNQYIIENDFDYSFNAINDLYTKVASQYGLDSSREQQSITQQTSEGKELNLAEQESQFGVEESPEAKMIREEERAEDKRTLLDKTKESVNNFKKDLKEWLTTDQQKIDDRKNNEVLKLKESLEKLSKSELKDDPEIADTINDMKTGKFLKDIVQETMTDENAFAIKNKIGRNTGTLKTIFGENYLKESGLSDILPKTKQNYKRDINKEINRLKDTKLTKEQQKLVNKDLSTLKTPNDFENHLARLQKISAKEIITTSEQQGIVTETKTSVSKEIQTAAPSETINVKEPSTITKAILSRYSEATQGISEAQFFDETDKSYIEVGYTMIEENAAIFSSINSENYEQIRNEIKADTSFYSDQALLIFDLYTLEMIGKFSPEIQNKIKAYNRRELTKSAQKLALQSKRVANKKPITHTLKQFSREGYKASISDEQIQKYDKKLKEKDAYIAELSNQIAELEKRIKETENELERQILLKEVKEVSDHKLTIETGTNEDIADWIVTHAETVEQATKIQTDVLKTALNAAEKAEAENKNVGYFFYNKDGTPKPFPEVREFIANALRKLKSFRMWAMLSSPVTWVRNWVGNMGMKALDGATNSIERFISKRFGFDTSQMKYNETRAGKEVYNHIAKTNENFIRNLIRGEGGKYDETGEKAAETRRRLRAKEYESANAFQKACLKAQDLTDWGLSTGPLGDEPVVFDSICKNMGNLVASNTEFLLTGIRNEMNALKNRARTPSQDTRLSILEKALKTKDPKDIFDALSKEETTRLFDQAKQMSFQQYFKNQNNFNKWLSNLSSKNPILGELATWIMPFPKVAGNILSMAYRYSPLGFMRALVQWSQSRQITAEGYKGRSTGFEQAEMIRAVSEASVGTILMIAGAIAAALGWVDIDEDDYLGPCFNFGDVRIGLSQLAPSMTTFSTAAAMVWAWKNNKSGVSEALGVLYDNTLLGNIENIFRYSSPEQYMANISISYVSQYIPAVLKLVNKAVLKSPQKDKSGPYFSKLIKTLGSYVPFVSELVPNKIDPYTGKKVYASGSDNWFLNFIAGVSPIDIKYTRTSDVAAEAEQIGAETTGLSGSFVINGKTYKVTDKEKEKLAKYRANYIESRFEDIVSGKEKITVEDENGKRITTTYDKLTDSQKNKVLKRLYSDATEISKIKHWIDSGNTYVTANRDEYNKYKKELGSGVKYRQNWSKSKFVEG